MSGLFVVLSLNSHFIHLLQVVDAFKDSNRTQLDNFITLLEDINRIGAAGVPNNAAVQEVMNLVCDNNVSNGTFNAMLKVISRK